MKEATDLEGNKVMVEDSVPVRTVAGKGHFLLNDAEKEKLRLREEQGRAERADYLANRKHLDDRKAVRPSVEEQLEMQHQDALNGTSTWKDMMDETAARFPKPA